METILRIPEDLTDRETATAQNTVTVLLGAAVPVTGMTALQREMKEAREEFALFVNTGWARAMGILFTTLGIALTLMFGITAGSLGIASIFIDSLAAKMDTVLMIFLPAMAISFIMAVCGNHMRKKIKRFRSYVKTLNGKPYGTIKDLAKGVRKPEKFVRKDLKKMIKKQMFLEGHLDKGETCLIASDEAYDQYLAAEKNAEQMKKEAAEDPGRSFLRKRRKSSKRETAT